jgi:5-methylcytosine-specific restriction endonuclease McrA
MEPVLLLDQSYAPLHVCNTPRALALLDKGKAELIEAGASLLSSASTVVEQPSVIRLRYHVKTPPRRVALTREALYARDRHTCQYCGVRAKHLTLDHVLPRHQGGKSTWTNLVTACGPCNHKKGGRTPEQAKMPLRSVPVEPTARWGDLPRLARYLANPRLAGWLKFAPSYATATA